MREKLLIIIIIPAIIAPLFNTKSRTSQWFYFKCVKVIDGDTLILRRNQKEIRVRLAYIDAPELMQSSLDGVAVGKMITEFLQQLLQGKVVKVKLLKRDIYHRWLGEVYWNNYFINLLLIEKGLSILYPLATFRSLSQKQKFLAGFYFAMQRRVGIWKTKGILNPYYFRKLSRK